MMTDNEVVERLSNALRHVELVVDLINPSKQVIIFCEDKENELTGKKYILYISTPLDHWRNFFEPKQDEDKRPN